MLFYLILISSFMLYAGSTGLSVIRLVRAIRVLRVISHSEKAMSNAALRHHSYLSNSTPLISLKQHATPLSNSTPHHSQTPRSCTHAAHSVMYQLILFLPLSFTDGSDHGFIRSRNAEPIVGLGPTYTHALYILSNGQVFFWRFF